MWNMTLNMRFLQVSALLAAWQLPSNPPGSAVHSQLFVPPVGPIEDLHLQAGVPCRAHIKKAPSLSKGAMRIICI